MPVSVTSTAPAHPRSRGENDRVGAAAGAGVGSSPLARGKQSPRYARGRRIGLIPARAGKTSGSRATAVRRAAHPRSRGENFPACLRRKSSCGSSPLARGKRCAPRPGRGSSRLIPARAGKTVRRPTIASTAGAHPRSRGENSKLTAEARQEAGSSPLARGKPGCAAAGLAGDGLIPARAGKTTDSMASTPPPGAHPRSRGENHASALIAAGVPGSSPLARGKQRAGEGCAALGGLIPARAGKTEPCS